MLVIELRDFATFGFTPESIAGGGAFSLSAAEEVLTWLEVSATWEGSAGGDDGASEAVGGSVKSSNWAPIPTLHIWQMLDLICEV